MVIVFNRGWNGIEWSVNLLIQLVLWFTKKSLIYLKNNNRLKTVLSSVDVLRLGIKGLFLFVTEQTQKRWDQRSDDTGGDQQDECSHGGVTDLTTQNKVHLVDRQVDVVHQGPVSFTPSLLGQEVHTRLQLVVDAAQTGSQESTC